MSKSSWNSPVLLVMAVLAMVGSAQAILIDFSSPGYAVGDLDGQGATATKWSNGGDGPRNIVISESGNQAVQLQSSTSGTCSWYTFNPTDSDLGQTFNTGSSILDYGFKVRWDDRRANYGSTVWGVYVGAGYSNNAVFLAGSANGDIRISHGNGDTNITGENHAEVGQWLAISGTIDFSTKKFTVSLDGVDKGTYNFGNSSTNKVEILLSSWNAANTNTFCPCSFDDIRIGNVPEPATMGLFALGVLGVLKRKK